MRPKGHSPRLTLEASKQSKIPDVLGKNKYSPLEVEQAFEVGTSDDDDKTLTP
jgi:hypothetical protein